MKLDMNALLEILIAKKADFEIDSGFLNVSKAMKAQKALMGRSRLLSKFNSDIVLSFGGDGTLLEVFRELKKKIPVMGINCGSRGYLQAFRHYDAGLAVEAAFAGNFTVEKRARVLARIDGKNAGEALNEVLVVPEKAGRLLRFSLKISNSEREQAGDGLIVDTPTGSTGHALSAGGPVVKGNASVFVVVSLNPIDWSHRPLIINDHEKVMAFGFEKTRAEAIIDGQKRIRIKSRIELEKGSEVLFAVPK